MSILLMILFLQKILNSKLLDVKLASLDNMKYLHFGENGFIK